jgi:hypothetical protein
MMHSYTFTKKKKRPQQRRTMNIVERFQAGWGSKDVCSCGDDDDELWTCSECWAEVSEEELVMLPCFHPMCSLCLAHMLMDSNCDQEEGTHLHSEAPCTTAHSPLHLSRVCELPSV